MKKILSILAVMLSALAASLFTACSNDVPVPDIVPEKGAAVRMLVTFAVSADIANLWDITAEFTDINGKERSIEMLKVPTTVDTGNGQAEMCVINIGQETIALPASLDIKITYTRNTNQPCGDKIDGSYLILKRVDAINAQGEIVSALYQNSNYKKSSYPVDKIDQLQKMLESHNQITLSIDKDGRII